MGWLTTSSKTGGTLTGKAKHTVTAKVNNTKKKIAKGKTCLVCGRPLVSLAPSLVSAWTTKPNVHPRCTQTIPPAE